jgi:hypothetical protein
VNDKQQRARDRAVQLIQHYVETAFRKSGLKWTSDNEAELADFVDRVIEAATPPPLSEHAERVKPLLGGQEGQQ